MTSSLRLDSHLWVGDEQSESTLSKHCTIAAVKTRLCQAESEALLLCVSWALIEQDNSCILAIRVVPTYMHGSQWCTHQGMAHGMESLFTEYFISSSLCAVMWCY